MVVVTLDALGLPVLITAVNTCGCYVAMVPTSFLPQDAFPRDWENRPQEVYGEKLPWILDYAGVKAPRLLVRLRPEVHRVMGLEVIESRHLNDRRAFRTIRAPLIPSEELEEIPVNGSTTSFYYQEGAWRGHVKGAVKPMETLLLGLISLDFYVGMDKSYLGSTSCGNPFYTSLKPWNREESDMADFPEFLRFWGWNLYLRQDIWPCRSNFQLRSEDF